MSETVGLGAADADSRWLNIRRHQAVLMIVGLAMAGDWLVRAPNLSVEGVVALVLCIAALPMYDGMTGAEWLRVSAGFLCRSHWCTFEARRIERGIVISAGSEARFCAFALQHRGRLDLSSRDIDHANALLRLADGLATGDRARHFSLHTSVREHATSTFLVLPTDVHPPEGWREDNPGVLGLAGSLVLDAPSSLFERWRYVRDTQGLARVVRIRDFSAAPEGRALLGEIQCSDGSLDVALHVDVVATSRAHRVAARAVHRGGSDDATSQAAGFRRSARSGRTLERLRQREALVASGRALLRIGVYVVVRAKTIDELHTSVAAFCRTAHESGLRCERGIGQQARWYRNQLPGELHR
jgi:hypothetical protein